MTLIIGDDIIKMDYTPGDMIGFRNDLREAKACIIEMSVAFEDFIYYNREKIKQQYNLKNRYDLYKIFKRMIDKSEKELIYNIFEEKDRYVEMISQFNLHNKKQLLTFCLHYIIDKYDEEKYAKEHTWF